MMLSASTKRQQQPGTARRDNNAATDCGSIAAEAPRKRDSASATIPDAASSTAGPFAVSSVFCTRPCTGWAVRAMNSARSRPTRMACIVCCVTKARRASSALDTPASCLRQVEPPFLGGPLHVSGHSRDSVTLLVNGPAQPLVPLRPYQMTGRSVECLRISEGS
jgi:hypothetical protein